MAESMYRELILNSDAYFKGDKNHPNFIFPEDITLKKFCVRNVQLPNFNLNFPRVSEEVRVEWLTDATGEIWQEGRVIKINGPLNVSTVAELGAVVSSIFQLSLEDDFPGNGSTAVAVGDFFLEAGVALPADITQWRFVWESSDYFRPAKYLRRLLGDVLFNKTSDIYPGVDWKIGALKMTQNNYLLLKSNAMSGATFTPNGSRFGNSQSASILAKIPIDFSNANYGTYLFYSVNDSPSSETMFSYNGGKINMFDLYFTRPYDNDVIDFQGFNFSITLGILTNDVL
jgi:hypothetical protein